VFSVGAPAAAEMPLVVSVDCTTVHKVDHHEHEWRRIKYDDLATRSFADGDALHAAVDQALIDRAAAHALATHDYCRSA
jgi:hypothetical protein